MFGLKKKPKEPDYSKIPVLPNKLAGFVQAKYGLTPEELHKLFEALGRVEPNIKVARRQSVQGKEYSKPVGKVVTIEAAAEYEKERMESRLKKNKKILELLETVDFDDLMVRLEVNDSYYPKRLAPIDIVNSVEAAADKLDALDEQRIRKPRIYSPREEIVLDAITFIKSQEPHRLIRRISERQRAYIMRHSIEELEEAHAEWLRNLRGDPPPETEEEMMARLAAEQEQQLEEERLAAEEAAKNFDDLPSVRTLLDEIAELIAKNPEAATAIISQWIGNAVLLEAAEQ